MIESYGKQLISVDAAGIEQTGIASLRKRDIATLRDREQEIVLLLKKNYPHVLSVDEIFKDGEKTAKLLFRINLVTRPKGWVIRKVRNEGYILIKFNT